MKDLFETLASILKPEEDIYSDYDRDEDGNLISCCGDILDEDIMICPTCKEHN